MTSHGDRSKTLRKYPKGPLGNEGTVHDEGSSRARVYTTQPRRSERRIMLELYAMQPARPVGPCCLFAGPGRPGVYVHPSGAARL